MMRIDVVSLFPEFFRSPLSIGLIGKTLEAGRATVNLLDLRDFADDRHRTVDDAPYGGGAGMVMKPEPLFRAIRRANSFGQGPVLLMSPQGRPLQQQDLVRYAQLPHVVMVAGRYEGFDERVRAMVDEEISIGDFVLTGGEYAVALLIDGVLRLLPGTLGNADSLARESFSDGLLEHPHYTRPQEFEGAVVPDVLLSGNHKQIAKWRNVESLRRTRERRPDLLAARAFTVEELGMLREMSPAGAGGTSGAPGTSQADVTIALAWVRRPGEPWPEASVVEALSAVARAYRVSHCWCVSDLAPRESEQHESSLKRLPDVPALVSAIHQTGPAIVAALSIEPIAGSRFRPLPTLVRESLSRGATLVLAAGAGVVHRGEPAAWVDVVVPPLRGAAEERSLPVSVVFALALDRLRGEG